MPIDLESLNLGEEAIGFGDPLDMLLLDGPADETADTGDRDAEQDSAEELDEIEQGFRDRKKQERDRLYEAIDSEYWFCVCFQTREQKEEFLRKLDLLDIGDKYLDGLQVADRMNVTLDNPVPPIRKVRRNRKLESMTEEVI